MKSAFPAIRAAPHGPILSAKLSTKPYFEHRMELISSNVTVYALQLPQAVTWFYSWRKSAAGNSLSVRHRLRLAPASDCQFSARNERACAVWVMPPNALLQQLAVLRRGRDVIKALRRWRNDDVCPVRAGANDDGAQVFRGNMTATDHFHELFVERSSLLIGARLATSLLPLALLVWK